MPVPDSRKYYESRQYTMSGVLRLGAVCWSVPRTLLGGKHNNRYRVTLTSAKQGPAFLCTTQFLLVMSTTYRSHIRRYFCGVPLVYVMTEVAVQRQAQRLVFLGRCSGCLAEVM